MAGKFPMKTRVCVINIEITHGWMTVMISGFFEVLGNAIDLNMMLVHRSYTLMRRIAFWCGKVCY